LGESRTSERNEKNLTKEVTLRVETRVVTPAFEGPAQVKKHPKEESRQKSSFMQEYHLDRPLSGHTTGELEKKKKGEGEGRVGGLMRGVQNPKTISKVADPG